MTRRTTSTPHEPDSHLDFDDDAAALQPAAEPIDLRELLRLHPRLLLASLIVAVVMIPVGFFLAALGVAVLEFSGGAARDTGIVVGTAGFAVADFWGGGIVATLTRARSQQVAVAWVIGRLPIILGTLLLTGLWLVALAQLLTAAPIAWAGARVARKQAALRRQIRAERDTPAQNMRR